MRLRATNRPELIRDFEARHRAGFVVLGGLPSVLQLVDTDSAPSASPQSFNADTLRLGAALGVLEDLLPRPARCWGVNLGTFCPCDFHDNERQLAAWCRERCSACDGTSAGCHSGVRRLENCAVYDPDWMPVEIAA